MTQGNTTNHPEGQLSHNWKGGIIFTDHGYVQLRDPKHPRSNLRGYVYEHILVVEDVIGKKIPNNAEIHHVDGNGMNNKNRNLVLCNDSNYHKLIHTRTRAFLNCGNANWVMCQFCKKYDDPKEMYRYKDKSLGYHRGCHNTYKREKRNES